MYILCQDLKLHEVALQRTTSYKPKSCKTFPAFHFSAYEQQHQVGVAIFIHLLYFPPLTLTLRHCLLDAGKVYFNTPLAS